jgi:hypothetical protein
MPSFGALGKSTSLDTSFELLKELRCHLQMCVEQKIGHYLALQMPFDN